MKNIGKPCAGKLHARFDEGGQARACSLLYPALSALYRLFVKRLFRARQVNVERLLYCVPSRAQRLACRRGIDLIKHSGSG